MLLHNRSHNATAPGAHALGAVLCSYRSINIIRENPEHPIGCPGFKGYSQPFKLRLSFVPTIAMNSELVSPLLAISCPRENCTNSLLFVQSMSSTIRSTACRIARSTRLAVVPYSLATLGYTSLVIEQWCPLVAYVSNQIITAVVAYLKPLSAGEKPIFKRYSTTSFSPIPTVPLSVPSGTSLISISSICANKNRSFCRLSIKSFLSWIFIHNTYFQSLLEFYSIPLLYNIFNFMSMFCFSLPMIRKS